MFLADAGTVLDWPEVEGQGWESDWDSKPPAMFKFSEHLLKWALIYLPLISVLQNLHTTFLEFSTLKTFDHSLSPFLPQPNGILEH